MSGVQNHWIEGEGSSSQKCHSKFLSMEFGKQQYWALLPSLPRKYLPAKPTKGASKALTVLNTHTHISLVSHQSRGLFILEKHQKFKKKALASKQATLPGCSTSLGNITAPVCSVFTQGDAWGIRMGVHCREKLGTSETWISFQTPYLQDKKPLFWLGLFRSRYYWLWIFKISASYYWFLWGVLF